MKNKDHDLGADAAAVDTARSAEAATTAPHVEPLQCAMCEYTFKDDEIIHVVEMKLVCEDCYNDLPEAE